MKPPKNTMRTCIQCEERFKQKTGYLNLSDWVWLCSHDCIQKYDTSKNNNASELIEV